MTNETHKKMTLFFPELDKDAHHLECPISKVTVLEDRAQVLRAGSVSLPKGRYKLLIDDVAPLLHDVSLRTEKLEGSGTIHDIRLRRAAKVSLQEQPEPIRILKHELQQLLDTYQEQSELRERAEHRYSRLFEMIQEGIIEIPEDASWGLVNHQSWHDTFHSLFQNARKHLEEAIKAYFTQLDLQEETHLLIKKIHLLETPKTQLIGCIELDVEAHENTTLEFQVGYVVPNALWRPQHSAQLFNNGTLKFSSSAALWQRTGEDWKNAQLFFSTARSSLGTEAPLLHDDLLQANRKSEELHLEQRQVSVQSTSTGSTPFEPEKTTIELPGVDDGGELQNLEAYGKQTILGDGSFHLIPLFQFESTCQKQLIGMPELDNKIFLESRQTNTSSHPLLAGPVELIREGGFVGWTKTLFVAPKEEFALNFGPDDGLRLTRLEESEAEIERVGGWEIRTTTLKLYLSNLENERKELYLTERIPVSEIEHVKIAVLQDEKDTSPQPRLDQNGFCHWKVTLDAHQQEQLKLTWTLSTSPKVQSLS